jgi:outer membrane cobalamin receptor
LANYRRFVLPNSRYAESEVIVGNDFDLKYTVGKDKVRNYTLPNVTVKARLKTEKDVPTNKFYSTNFKDQEEIEERAFGTLYDILRDMPGITITQVEDTGSDSESDNGVIESIIATSWGSNRPSKGGDGSGKTAGRKWEILTNRGASLLGENNIPILVDGVKFTAQDYDFILFMPAFEIESVELLRAWQTLAYVTGAINGAILVKTRGYREREPLPSKGAMYTPTGLSKLGGTMKEHPWVADKPGAYRLIVDVFSPEGIQSYEHRFEVVE